MKTRLLALAALGLFASAAAQAQTKADSPIKLNVGIVPSLGSIASYIAKDKGYYKELGLDVTFTPMNSSANVMAVFARGDLQIVEGGISVGYFNAINKKLPVIIASDRVSTPIHHQLLVGTQHKGKIKSVADLKGKIVGTIGAGSVTTYEVGKILETAGLTLKDIDLKVIPFPQMGIALKNGALDATMLIPPFAANVMDQGLGFSIATPDELVKPSPMTIAVTFVNTEWAAKNKEAVQKFYVAYLRATRDYCIAYHGGPNRKEVIDIALKNGLEKSAANLEKNPWTGRNLDGHVNMASVLDMQKYYVSSKLVPAASPPEVVATDEYIRHANRELGPLPELPKASKLAGCR